MIKQIYQHHQRLENLIYQVQSWFMVANLMSQLARHSILVDYGKTFKRLENNHYEGIEDHIRIVKIIQVKTCTYLSSLKTLYHCPFTPVTMKRFP